MRASASTLLGLPLLLLALSSAPPASGRLLKDSRSAPDASFLLRVLMGTPHFCASTTHRPQSQEEGERRNAKE